MNKQGWIYKKLGEICAHKNKVLRANKYYAPNEQINYIDISSIDNSQNIIISTTPYILSNAPSRAQQIVEEGDILISLVRPNLKNIAIVSSNSMRLVASSGFCVLRTEADTNNRYVFYIVRGESFTKHLLGRVQGANYPAVREEDIKNYIIPIPPLAEQERIVDELDLLSGIIEKKKEQLKAYDQLAQSIFYTMFGDPIENPKGWDVKKLGEVCRAIGDGLHGTPQYDANGTIAFINGNNLIDGKITITPKTLYVNNSEAQKIHIELDTNTILLSINGTLGKTAVYNNEKVVLGKSACYCKLTNKLNVDFVLSLMNTNTFKCFLESNSSKSTIKNVGLKAIRNYKVILPPLPLQQEFAEKVEAIERQKALVQQSIAKVQTLFDSRMDYWFG